MTRARLARLASNQVSVNFLQVVTSEKTRERTTRFACVTIDVTLTLTVTGFLFKISNIVGLSELRHEKHRKNCVAFCVLVFFL